MSELPRDSASRELLIVIPTYEDWDALVALLVEIDRESVGDGWRVNILIVDDGSDSEPPLDRLVVDRVMLESVQILRLRRNLGHQRAIAVALSWVEANASCDAVIVMDGDGEDAPSDIPRLVECYDRSPGAPVVFAARQRRSEGVVFQTFYHAYRGIHWLLTGVGVRVGNFSLVPRKQLYRLVVVSDLWNHYAAAVFKARLPLAFVPTARARRLGGRPKMNFTQLVVHGLSAISVFGDRVGVRLLIAASLTTLLAGGVACAVVLSRVVSDLAFTFRLGLAIAASTYLALNLLVAATLFTFGVLGSRDAAALLPARDFGWFVAGHETLWTRND
jgi:glycosyltransferase involved in cell wall biosynthesis